jgi:hypothetical protein
MSVPEKVTLDFELMTDGPFTTICLDLLMYESPQLFSVAMRLLVRKFSTKAVLRQKLARMQLIIRDNVLANYQKIQQTIVRLQSSMNAFPVWAMGNLPLLDADEQVANRESERDIILDLLHDLAQITMEEPVDVHQDMLRRAGTVDVIFSMLRLRRRIPKPEHTAPRKVRIAEHNRVLDEVAIKCHKFLAIFARHHPINQELLYGHIEYLVDLIDDTPDDSTFPEETKNAILATAGVIFDGNMTLVRKVTPKYAEMLVRGMMKNGAPKVQEAGEGSGRRASFTADANNRTSHFDHALEYINFFVQLCEVNGETVPTNQQLLMDLFNKEEYKASLMNAFQNHSRRSVLSKKFIESFDTTIYTVEAALEEVRQQNLHYCQSYIICPLTDPLPTPRSLSMPPTTRVGRSESKAEASRCTGERTAALRCPVRRSYHPRKSSLSSRNSTAPW